MEGSFEEFVTASGGRLLRTALLLTGERAAAEDLLQDVLERVYVRWRSVQDPQAYARTAMTRAVTDRWRRAGRRPREVPLQDWHERAVADGAVDRAARAGVVAQLRLLPPRQRAVIVLRYFEDWSEERIADELDVSRGTVKSQAAKGLARLRELMGADEEEMSRW
ncbi:SigE family RNA polymerase sigma factor [Kineococcus indalonis]|uniref:SigE family RNA polymerase sigma factor n=1 Tax=Kineococcus indalonis TaxID=2696566 RepID=UPI001411EDB7|nr:SigE family RNA polymerase sigma factor [Kineococcus indalonis]NAZ88730.1 SigE family RNA polymerase sigma factor [Kineococcus indalonis]